MGPINTQSIIIHCTNCRRVLFVTFQQFVSTWCELFIFRWMVSFTIWHELSSFNVDAWSNALRLETKSERCQTRYGLQLSYTQFCSHSKYESHPLSHSTHDCTCLHISYLELLRSYYFSWKLYTWHTTQPTTKICRKTKYRQGGM